MKEHSYSLIKACRSCSASDFLTIWQVPPVPVAGIYYREDSSPLSIKAPMTLECCRSCGLIQLKETINPEIYGEYSFVGDSAASYQQHLRQLAEFLVNEWGILNRRVFEVGASNGVLLELVGTLGKNEVLGIEPSGKLCRSAAEKGVEVVNGFFNASFLNVRDIGKFDCVIVRHVLEHIDQLNEMLSSIRSVIGKDGLLVVEVPDVDQIVGNKLFSNIFHEHLNYFSSASLENLMAKYGFESVFSKSVDIHGGSLLHFFKVGNAVSPREVSVDWEGLRRFSETTQNYFSSIRRKVVELKKSGAVVHGYGASHRTFVLLGNSSLGEAELPVIYDNNRLLHNKRLNGFHSLVQPKEAVCTNRPDVVVIFATSYEDEIVRFLKNRCDFKGEIVSVKYEAICE